MALQGNFATAIGDIVTDLVSADKVNIGEAIWQEAFGVNSFAGAHTLITDVRHGKTQPIVLTNDYYSGLPVGDETSCDLNSGDLTPNYAAKKWSLSEYNERIEICMRSFDEEFLLFWNMYRQRLEDPTQEPDAQAFLSYISEIVEKRVAGSQWRVGYWGDTSKTGNTLVSGNDGYYVQAEAGSGEKIELPQVDSTAEQIYGKLQEAYEYAVQQLWFNNSDVVIKMPYKIAAKLVAWLNTMQDTSQYNCECYDADGITAKRRFNVDGLQIFGLKVEAHREIDFSSSPAGETDLEKILIIRKSNLLIGTNTQGKMEGFDMFYDKVSRKIYIDTMIHLGLMIPLDEYVYITAPSV